MDFITIVLQQAFPCILLGFGIFLTYRILDFADLTAEGSFLIGSGLAIVLINNGVNPFLATLISLLGGAACGVFTGVLNRFLKIPKLLSGIITMTMCGSLILIIMGRDELASSLSGVLTFNSKIVLDDSANTIYSMFYGGVIKNVWVNIIIMFLVVAVVMCAVYFFFGTQYGMAIRSTGINEKMSRSQGINTTTTTITCIAISNALIGLAGALMAQKIRSVTPIDSVGYLVIGLAVILIGEAIFGKRSFLNCMISVSLGSIVYFVIVQLVFLIGFPTQLSKLLYAIMIVIALCLPAIKKGIARIFKKKDKVKGAI